MYLLDHLIGTGIASLVGNTHIQMHTHTQTHITSSFLQRWMFIGFSSSSSSALHRVLCLSSSRWTWYNSLLHTQPKYEYSNKPPHYVSIHTAVSKVWSSECSPEVVHVGHTLRECGSLPPHSLHFKFEDTDVLQSLRILHLSNIQGRLLNLDLFVQQCQLVVTTDHLSPQNITLIDDL